MQRHKLFPALVLLLGGVLLAVGWRSPGTLLLGGLLAGIGGLLLCPITLHSLSPKILWGGSLAAVTVIFIWSLSLGAVSLSLADLWAICIGKGEAMATSILLYARLPRTLAALAAGAALSMAGAVLQNVLANPLASPGIIGVNAGAGLGVTLCCAAGVLSGWGISLAAFIGSLAAVGIISLFSYRIGASKSTVILGGVALNSLLGALSEGVTVLDPEIAVLSLDFRVGGFSAVSYSRLLPAAALILLGGSVLLTLCNELDVVSLGDETAQSVGLPVARYRILFLVLSALLAGAAVSVAGLLGFLGLLVPHFVRRLSGNESRRLLPLSALAGGGFLMLTDLLSRLLFAPYELPVGILMAAIGAPLFVGLLVRSKGGHRHA